MLVIAAIKLAILNNNRYFQGAFLIDLVVLIKSISILRPRLQFCCFSMVSSRLDIVDIVLADDDSDDCLLFKDALAEFDVPTHLTTLGNGAELMTFLGKADLLPDIIFLDLNMPRKNGYECLMEIKQSIKLKLLPVIIFSTSFEPQVVELVYNQGAIHYICKPNEYSKLVSVVHYAIAVVTQPLAGERELYKQLMKDFVLLPEMCYNETKK